MANLLENRLHAAKAYLLTGDDSNLYDHLTECLSKILDERPENPTSNFEELSRSVKREKLKLKSDVLQDTKEESSRAELAVLQKPLFEPSQLDEGDVDADEEVVIPFPNVVETMSYFEEGGVGLGKDENYRILLGLKQLTKQFQLTSVRFWGKMFGTDNNYLIAEGELEGDEEEEQEQEEDKPEVEEEKEEDKDEEGEGEEKDELPQSVWKKPPVIPKEEAKTGTNKKMYFACNKPGDQWIKLPHVKPIEIVLARQIKKLFTGNLTAPVMTFPPFPGKEINYLRAQIARISATTQISPTGFYQFEEEEEEPEEGEGPGPIEVNKEFEISKTSEYADGSMSNWCHHVQYILPQGRCQWFNPIQKADDEFDEEDDDEDKEQPEEIEPESGPQVLTSAAEDSQIDGMPAWSARISSNIVPQYALAIVSSNLWPGAYAFAGRSKFENVYIGWGVKYSSTTFNPVLPPTIQEEFPTGADITETTDPTIEQEAALKAAMEEKELAQDNEEEPEDSDDD